MFKDNRARTDPLTGLPGQRSFIDVLERACTRLGGYRERFCLVLIGLDDFHNVSTAPGHESGRELLLQMGERLRGCVTPGDFVARLEGDRFAVLQTGHGNRTAAEGLAEQIRRSFSAPFILDGAPVFMKLNIGVALAPLDGAQPTPLIEIASAALSCRRGGTDKANESGAPAEIEKKWPFDASSRDGCDLARDLELALANEELHLVFQPIIDIASARDISSARIVGCEALARWDHRRRGPIAPSDFIPIAESTGLILPLGEWILREACREAAHWPAHMRVAVNLSPSQVSDAAVAARLLALVAESGFAPSRLEVEITETALPVNETIFVEALEMLRSAGAAVAIDDFGAGYCSINYLRRFPLDRIKIDRSFVSDIPVDRKCAAIIEMVLGLARKLGIATTAEGVETQEQLNFLREMGCREAQGYLIAKPMKPDALDAFLKANLKAKS